MWKVILMHVKMFYLASIYMIMLNYICMHVLRNYGRLKMCKECICIFICIYMGFNDKVNVLNEFISVFGRKVLLMVTLTPYDCYD